MKSHLIRLIVPILLIIMVCFSSCGGSKSTAITPAEPRGTTGTITTGQTVTAASTDLPATGGTVSVTESGSPIDGLELTVPSGSYADSTKFTISYAPVEKHTFGEDFNPITPLIKVENGGQYAAEIMEMEVPVEVPADSFAMGFLYDEKTQTLEGLPTLAQDADSITIGTRHFSNFLISLIPLVKLKKDIDSHFRPGIDDWQFINRGSYIAQGGHCAGQSLSAIWYYCIQPDGKDLTLYNRYDNNGNDPDTPDFWQDDSLGYRFASTIQNDIEWDKFAFQFWRSQRGVSDELTWNLFAYSMQITGEPQMVGLTKEGKGGHAMICYRIKDGLLYIADPNYPGNLERKIEYANGKINPYESGANREAIEKGNSTRYDKVGYTGKTTIIDWNKIPARWAEFKKGTIGNDRFPAYQIVWTDEKKQNHELKDGYVSPSKLININGISLIQGTSGSIEVYRDGKFLKWDANGNYELNPGENKLGIVVSGDITTTDKNGNSSTESSYIDFQYITVNYTPSDYRLEPPVTQGQVEKWLTFTVVMPEDPEGKTFLWDWGDGTEVQKAYHNNQINHVYHTGGNFTVTVTVLDRKDKEIGKASCMANILAPVEGTVHIYMPKYYSIGRVYAVNSTGEELSMYSSSEYKVNFYPGHYTLHYNYIIEDPDKPFQNISATKEFDVPSSGTYKIEITPGE